MNGTFLSRVLSCVALLLLACFGSSCSLPPKEAWVQMRREGLIPFIANGMTAPKAVTPEESGAQLAKSTPTHKRPAADVKVAYPVQGLVGYVRTPYTSPTRLVNVVGSKAGGTVVCPYTQKPFIVPTAAVVPAANVAAVKAPPAPVRSVPDKPAPSVAAMPKPVPSVAATPKPVPSVAQKTDPAPQRSVAPSKPAPSPVPQKKPEPKPTPEVAKKEVAPAAKLPFGTPIPGRPGFVNSPYAERHQLVDVAGLAVGTEVKCPYTGKPFRVPPQAQAKR
jgi:uncharacterized Zn-finger protein